MRLFKTSFEFMKRVFQEGISQFEAPAPLETDVLCDELRVEFHKNKTVYKLLQKGLVIGEMETDGGAYPGDTLSLTDLKLYWTIKMVP